MSEEEISENELTKAEILQDFIDNVNKMRDDPMTLYNYLSTNLKKATSHQISNEKLLAIFNVNDHPFAHVYILALFCESTKAKDKAFSLIQKALRNLTNLPKHLQPGIAIFTKELSSICSFLESNCLENDSKAVFSLLRQCVQLIKSEKYEISKVHVLFLRECVSQKFMLIGYEQSISPVYGIFDENMPMKDILEYFVHASLICLTLRHDAEAMKVLKMGLCIPFTKVDEQVLLLYRRYILTSLIVTGQPPSPIPFISEDNAKILQNKSSFIHPIVECFVTFPSTSSSSSTPSSSSLSEATPLSLFNEDQLSAVILSNEKELRDAGVLSLARRCIQALKEINFKRIIQAYGAMPLNSLASATNRSVSDSIRYLLLLASQSKLQLSIDEKRGTVTFAEGLTSDETNESSKMDEDRSSMKMSQGSEQKFSSSYEKRKEMELAISFAEQMNKIGQIAQQLGFTDDALSLSSFLISRF